MTQLLRLAVSTPAAGIRMIMAPLWTRSIAPENATPHAAPPDRRRDGSASIRTSALLDRLEL
ncbi:MAG: hypothetical protein AB7J30_05000 [Hyphomicrobium sp.]|uniref:hypothetical protein n=1 Tax=Hyphomicrobium sp. TaxID=82 RepID=UPI003D151BC3